MNGRLELKKSGDKAETPERKLGQFLLPPLPYMGTDL